MWSFATSHRNEPGPLRSASGRIVAIVLALVLNASRLAGQCDWTKRVLQALQNRFGVNESACKTLLLAPDEFSREYQAVENGIFTDISVIQVPPVQSLLQGYARAYLDDSGNGDMAEPVHVTADLVPNAFATGHMVFFSYGIVQWYQNPESLLERLGFRQADARAYLESVSQEYPGEQGLVAILAHETAHNLLGHPDAYPLVNGCERYINAGVTSVKQYEEELATGKKPSGVREILKQSLLAYGETFLETRNQQQKESDADTYGAWLAWRQTGDPYAMSRALLWLSRFPGSLPGSGSAAVFEVLCSDHANLLARVQAATILGGSFADGGGIPESVKEAPVKDVATRYQEFLAWYPKKVEEVQRIAAGQLSPEETRTVRALRVESKPKGAVLWVDGHAAGTSPGEVQVTLGPHVLKADLGGRSVEQRIVVFEDVPTKIKLDLRK